MEDLIEYIYYFISILFFSLKHETFFIRCSRQILHIIYYYIYPEKLLLIVNEGSVTLFQQNSLFNEIPARQFCIDLRITLRQH